MGYHLLITKSPKERVTSMPIATQDLAAEEFLRHNNVCVYRTYDDDDIDNGVNTYWFTLDPYGREGDDITRFDVRSLEVPAAAKLKEHPPFITPRSEERRVGKE